jgi:phosphohistidine phosphatase SixA
MKRIAIIRHGERFHDDISNKQLAAIRKHGIKGLSELVIGQKVYVHLGSEMPRTAQTIHAFEEHAKKSYSTVGYREEDSRFGSYHMFLKFFLHPIIMQEKNHGHTWLAAFEKENPSFLKKTQDDMVAATKELFNGMDDNTLMIMPGHSPLIEWLVFALDPEHKVSRDIHLSELTGFVIEQDIDGHIKVTKTINTKAW